MRNASSLILVGLVLDFTACTTPAPDRPAATLAPATLSAVPVVPDSRQSSPAPTTTSALSSVRAFITVTESANVRNGPGTDFEVIGMLSPDRQYPVNGRSGDWWEIELGEHVGWVYAAITNLSGDPQGIPEMPRAPAATASPGSTPTGLEAAIRSIRKLIGEPDLALTFIEITTMINSPNGDLRVGRYADSLGREYMVETEGSRVVEIDPSAVSVSASATTPTLTQSELRFKAQQFVSENTPGFAGIRDTLHYEEGTKDGRTYFFRWEDRNATGSRFNRPFAQVGMSVSGKVVSYFNTLFLR